MWAERVVSSALAEHAVERGLASRADLEGIAQAWHRWAAAAAEIPVIEAEQPTRKTRRGKGKSDPMDAHPAVLYALQLTAEKSPTPRADGDREALRILLCARQELTTTSTGQINRLKALLRDGDDTDRRLARAGSPTPPCLGWPDAACLARPAESEPCATARSAAWLWPCATRAGCSRLTGLS
ncbi:MAG: hypothetical protein WAK86_10495 [Pseudonocardiaceae bacterium]